MDTLITAAEESDGYCDLGIVYRASGAQIQEVLCPMLDSCGSEATKEFGELFGDTEE
jgi:hypothetical protein